MTRLSFSILCGELLLNPDFLIAEDEGLRVLLASRASDADIRAYLIEQY